MILRVKSVSENVTNIPQLSYKIKHATLEKPNMNKQSIETEHQTIGSRTTTANIQDNPDPLKLLI